MRRMAGNDATLSPERVSAKGRNHPTEPFRLGFCGPANVPQALAQKR